jgi:transposase
MALRLRDLSDNERTQIRRLSQARTAAARTVERAQIIQLASKGLLVPAIARQLGIGQDVVRQWLKRFNAEGLAGLRDRPRSGRPTTYSPEQVGEMIAAALTNPHDLGQAFGSWTFQRLARYLNETQGIGIQPSRLHEILSAEGLRWRTQESWFGARVDPDFAQKKGALRPSVGSRRRAASSSISMNSGPSRPSRSRARRRST